MHREPNQDLRTLAGGLNVAGVLVTAVLVVAGAWLVVGRLTADPGAPAERLAALCALLADEHRLRAEHGRLRLQWDKAQKDEAAIQKRIPPEPQEAVFLAQVSQAANDVQLQIKDYRPGATGVGKTWSTLRVDLTCEGDYPEICAFLDGLRELPRYSTVAHLEIDPGTAAKQYLAKLCLELYFFNDSHKLAAK